MGAGQGSIAVWLSLRVGATGTVVATDLDTHLLEALPYHNLSVMRHDVATDPLPTDTFDLVHTRLVLMHVRDRNRALDTLVASLRPGGWFVGEEFDALLTLADPSVSASEALLKTGIAMRRLMTDRGVDLRCGRTLRDRLLAQGLVDVQAEGTISVWHGGSPGAALIRLSYEQLAEPMIQGGDPERGGSDRRSGATRRSRDRRPLTDSVVGARTATNADLISLFCLCLLFFAPAPATQGRAAEQTGTEQRQGRWFGHGRPVEAEALVELGRVGTAADDVGASAQPVRIEIAVADPGLQIAIEERRPGCGQPEEVAILGSSTCGTKK